jgi:hypothetical protein
MGMKYDGYFSTGQWNEQAIRMKSVLTPERDFVDGEYDGEPVI